jgi:hypothetical protein
MPANNEITPQSVREAVANALEATFKAGRSPDDASVWHTAADAAMDVIALASAIPLANQNTDSVLEGMVPWTGGDEAPADWDGGAVKLRDGTITTCKPGEYDTWQWGEEGEGSIVAYTSKSTGSSDSYTPAGEVERISRAIDPGAWDDELPGMTRDAVTGFHMRRQQANAAAERVRAALTQGGSHGTE